MSRRVIFLLATDRIEGMSCMVHCHVRITMSHCLSVRHYHIYLRMKLVVPVDMHLASKQGVDDPSPTLLLDITSNAARLLIII